jgi:hypothetical protein
VLLIAHAIVGRADFGCSRGSLRWGGDRVADRHARGDGDVQILGLWLLSEALNQ